MSKLQTQYNKLASSLAALETFVANYGDKLEEVHNGALSVDGCYDDHAIAGFNVSLTWSPDERRNSELAVLGEVFGRNGWTAHHNEKHIDWHMTVDGVSVCVFGAKRLPPPPPEAPVHPTEFPLQLLDTIHVEEESEPPTFNPAL